MTVCPPDDCTDLPVFPQCPDNRPGLARIRRRIGTYATIREALFYQLDRDPILGGWSHRESDDPGIALLEGAAIVGDILTFYQELYANEAYLGTARWLETVGDLVRLLGYRLAPGVGGKGVFAFEVTGDLPVTIPVGFPISAELADMEDQAEFQTTDQVVAWPGLGRFHLFPPLIEQPIVATTTELLIDAPATLYIDKGDRFLIGEPDNVSTPGKFTNPEIVIVDDVREWHGERLVTIKGHLQRSTPANRLSGYKIGRTFRHFGHAAPPTNITIGSNGTASQDLIGYTRLLNGRTTSFISPSLAARDFPLDETVDDLAMGVTIICQFTTLSFAHGRETTSELVSLVRSIVGIRQSSFSWGAITSPSTVLTLSAPLVAGGIATDPLEQVATLESDVVFAIKEFAAGTSVSGQTAAAAGGNSSMFAEINQAYHGSASKSGDIRDMAFHETLSPLVQFRAKPVPTSSTKGAVLNFEGTAALASVLPNRQLILARPGDKIHTVTVQSVAAPGAGGAMLREITLDTEVGYADFPMDNPQVNVFGNLAPATQGKAERDVVLGNGDNREAFQTFPLPKGPLTYLLKPSATPPAVPELDVFVNERRWKRVSSLIVAKPTDEVYIVREDLEESSYVQFGDGLTGSRTPSGIGNIVARFRTGNRAFGPLAEGATPSAGIRLDRLNAITLPDQISGGSVPESAENAREVAPGTAQSLDRLVSLRDYETETLALPGVSLVRARWDLVDNVPSVILNVLMDNGRDAEIEQIRRILTTANRKRGPARFPVIVVAGARINFTVTVQVAIDDTFQQLLVLDEIRRTLAVAGLSGSDADGTTGRTFGEHEYASRIEGSIQAVLGVRWVRVTIFRQLRANGPFAEHLFLAKSSRQTRLIPGPNEVLALHTDHLHLQPFAAIAAGVE